MKSAEYWFVTVVGVVLILGGLFFLMRVPEKKGSEYLDLTATPSATMKIKQFEPIKGSVKGGDLVVIQGERFSEGVEVVFGERLAPKVERKVETELVATVPAATQSGAVKIRVVAPNGEVATSEQYFFYLE